MFTSFKNDQDFITFWKTNAQFFAYYVILARKYSQFYKREELLLEYLRERGLLICDDETLENLQFLMKHYYDEIRKRGTIQIITKATVFDSDNSDSDSDSFSEASKEVDGELLRTICFDKCDEFIFNFRRSEKLGLNIGNSSPLYRGTSNMEGVNKVWALLLSATDYLKYPLFGASFISSISEGDESDSDTNNDALLNSGYTIKFSGLTTGDAAGIGEDTNFPPPPVDFRNQYALNVDNNIDYQFSFRVKASAALAEFLHVTIFGYDCDGNPVAMYRVDDLSPWFDVIQGASLNQADKYFYFSCIVYGKDKFPLHDNTGPYAKDIVVRDGSNNFYISIHEAPIGILLTDTTYWRPLSLLETNSFILTSWNAGINLQFGQDVKKIIPTIKVANYGGTFTGDLAFITDVEIKPVMTNYSSGFIQTNNWIDFWLKNNSQNYSYDDLKAIFRHYLLPYDTEFEFNELEKFQYKPRTFTFNIAKIIEL